MQKVDLNRLCKRLGYTFRDIALLKKALTHRSAASENNECLEFLGDSILNFVIAHELFKNHPRCNEGELSRFRSWLVRGDCLAELASELSLGDYLSLGQGELKSGGYRRASILADALEAIFAAIYLDSNFETISQIISQLFQSRIHDENMQNHMKDSKTALQEYLQARKLPLPLYELTRVEGGEHDQMFYVNCSVAKLNITTEGNSVTRRKAEQIAARAFLKMLGIF